LWTAVLVQHHAHDAAVGVALEGELGVDVAREAGVGDSANSSPSLWRVA
jgi:hypothetical protein